MTDNGKNGRDIGLDITRIIAFAFVPAVHFFLNSGFYGSTIKGTADYLMIVARTAFAVCVPLFMLITGYLMSSKSIEINPVNLAAYYKKLSKVLITYVFSILLITAFRITSGEGLGAGEAIISLLNFDYYSWYIEMYIGLFLLTPFLNSLWKTLDTGYAKKALVIVLMILTALPSVINIWAFSDGGINAITQPWLYGEADKLIPAWWKGIYPITYYYIGAYLHSEIDIKKLRTGRLILLFVFGVFCFGLFNYYRSYSISFVWGEWNSWQSMQNMVDAVLVFLIINSINYKNRSKKISKVLAILSEITLGAYLLSWIPDHYFYPKMIESVPGMIDRYKMFPVVAGKTIIVSFFLSWLIYLVANRGIMRSRKQHN